jgi:hypothetical protein
MITAAHKLNSKTQIDSSTLGNSSHDAGKTHTESLIPAFSKIMAIMQAWMTEQTELAID